MPNYRDAITGRFVTKAEADARPDTTVKEASSDWDIEEPEEQAE